MKAGLCMALAFLSLAAIAEADVVSLKNGDRVTGALVNVKDGNLDLKSDLLGDLTIPLKQVASFSTEKPVAVVVKGQTQPAEGQLSLEPSGDWQVTAAGKSQTIAAAQVGVIMPAEAYQKLVGTSPKLWQAWTGSAGLGYALQRGNQQTNTFSTNLSAFRERPETPVFQRHWRTNYTLTALLAHATEDGSTITSNTFTTNLRQDYLFTPNDFVFGFFEFDHIGPSGLYLRQSYGGGYGHDVIKTSRTTFSLLGGLDYVHEKFFDGSSDESAEALAGEKLGIQFTERVRLDHNLNFYPDLSNGGQYRFDTTTTLSAKLNTKFSLNAGVIDLYLSNPPPGNRKNNVSFTTGIGYTF
jgi:putative salt-induced outer membrane protein YdiY